MLENQFIQLIQSGNLPLVQGDYSTEINATQHISFTELCAIQAGTTYTATCASQLSTERNKAKWGSSSCLIVATGHVDYDLLPYAGVLKVMRWGENFEVAADATLYIAWGQKAYVEFLVNGGQPEEATTNFEMHVNSAIVGIHPVASIQFAKSRASLPVLMGSAYGLFLPKTPSKVGIVDPSGAVIEEETVSSLDKYIEIFGQAREMQTSYLEYADEQIAIGEMFFLRIVYQDNTVAFSQPLVRVPKDGMSVITYGCDEDAFGFPFHTDGDHKAYANLPIILSKPEYSQKDETYEKMDGDVVTLYAKYYKEWSGETEYLSEAMHDKIIAALSCDYVYINGKRVTKADNYSVNWDEYDIDCDGVTKIARATFKVRENITQRNSNY